MWPLFSGKFSLKNAELSVLVFETYAGLWFQILNQNGKPPSKTKLTYTP